MCYTKKKAAKEIVSMKTIITGKNYTPSDKLKETIEKKFEKLDKYFSNEITGNIMVIKEKAGYKVEATINAKGTIFRAEMRRTIRMMQLIGSSKNFRVRCPVSNPNSRRNIKDSRI